MKKIKKYTAVFALSFLSVGLLVLYHKTFLHTSGLTTAKEYEICLSFPGKEKCKTGKLELSSLLHVASFNSDYRSRAFNSEEHPSIRIIDSSNRSYVTISYPDLAVMKNETDGMRIFHFSKSLYLQLKKELEVNPTPFQTREIEEDEHR